MAITQYNVNNSTSTPAFTASGDIAVTVIYLCNVSGSGTENDAVVDVHIVPSGGSVSNDNKIYHTLTVRGSDTYVIDTEKLILANGDRIFISTPDSTGNVKATVSTIGL